MGSPLMGWGGNHEFSYLPGGEQPWNGEDLLRNENGGANDWFAEQAPPQQDNSGIEAQVRAMAAQHGIDYDPSDTEDVLRHGGDLSIAANKYAQRASSNGGGGGEQAQGGQAQGDYTVGGLNLGRGNAYNYTPFTEQFRAPTAEEARATPGYQFGLSEGQKALERSAAARGTLLTGGTAKVINRFGQDYADQNYGNVYNRALGEYMNRFQIDQANQGNAFTTGRAGRMDDFGIQSFYDQFGEQKRMNNFNMSRTNRMDDFNIYNTMDTNYWNRLFGLADYGQAANSQLIGANEGLAERATDAITGAGNANAAGQVAGANAYNNAISSIGNDVMMNQLVRNGRAQAGGNKSAGGTNAVNSGEYLWNAQF